MEFKDEENAAILLLDVQNEFLKPGGKLHESIKETLEKTEMLRKLPPFVKKARDRGATIIYAPVLMGAKTGASHFTEDNHDPQDYSNMKGLFMEGTWNAEFIEELAPKDGDITLTGRNDYSAFQGTELRETLKRQKITKLFVAGCLTNVCVSSTVIDADELGVADDGTQICVLEDGCVAETWEQHQNALTTALPMFCDILPCHKALDTILVRPKDSKSTANALNEEPETVDQTRQEFVISGRAFRNFHQVRRLRNAMLDKWIGGNFVRFLDSDGDGFVDYDEFYDFLHQFGIAQETRVDVAQVWSILDCEREGRVPTQIIADALDPRYDDGCEEGGRAPDQKSSPFPSPYMVALVAHNNMKPSMMKFVRDNLSFFSRVKLVTTGSTGRALSSLGLSVEHLVSSGPLGGDQEIGGLIAQGKVSAVFFFTDPLSAHPHAPDIVALNRICCVHDTMFANNPSSAKLLVFSLEHSAFGFSRLTGANPDIGNETDVVGKYKEGQAKVIQAVSVDNNGTTKSKDEALPQERHKIKRKSSILRAPRQSKSSPRESFGHVVAEALNKNVGRQSMTAKRDEEGQAKVIQVVSSPKITTAQSKEFTSQEVRKNVSKPSLLQTPQPLETIQESFGQVVAEVVSSLKTTNAQHKEFTAQEADKRMIGPAVTPDPNIMVSKVA